MDFDALLKAIKETVNGNKSRRKAACDNGLSSSTLSRYVIKVKEVFEEISTVSDVDLMDFLRKSRMFHPSKVVSVFGILFTKQLTVKRTISQELLANNSNS